MNKLDLIFEKEPPEVQRKLMNLLVQYNAIMQYNAKEDKFQVDLLLPFKTEQQKKEFIQNFKSRSGKKSGYGEQRGRESMHRDNGNNQHKKAREILQSQIGGLEQEHHNKQDIEQEVQEQEHQAHPHEREDQPQISYELTNQNYQISERRRTLSILDVSTIIKDKLRQAISIIKYQNQHGRSPDSQFYQSSHRNHDSIRLNKVEMEEEDDGMILSGLQQPQIVATNKKKRTKQEENNYHKIDEQREHVTNGGPSHQNNNQILINDQNQSEAHYDKPPEKEATPVVPPITGKVFKNYLQESRQQLRKQMPQQQRPMQSENVREMKQKLTQKYGTKRINSTNIRHKYSQFLKKNHRDFDRIYDTIRKEIKRNQTQLNRSRQEDPILILEQNLTDIHSEQDRIFKQEIIKDYQKHILAQNQNMSSQDLIRYFRYLLQNAKNIYVKNLRKGKI